jgi:hypothetical protein
MSCVSGKNSLPCPITETVPSTIQKKGFPNPSYSRAFTVPSNPIKESLLSLSYLFTEMYSLLFRETASHIFLLKCILLCSGKQPPLSLYSNAFTSVQEKKPPIYKEQNCSSSVEGNGGCTLYSILPCSGNRASLIPD